MSLKQVEGFTVFTFVRNFQMHFVVKIEIKKKKFDLKILKFFKSMVISFLEYDVHWS